MFYTYIYTDMRKPGKYTYSHINMSFLFEPFYVGKGIQNRYKAHLYNSNLQDNRNIHKNRKLNKILQNCSKKELISYIVQCNFSENEKWVLKQEELLIKQIGRSKYGGPLTNSTNGGEGELSGSKYDNSLIYDLQENKEIEITNIMKFNIQYNINIVGLFITNTKLMDNRFCKVQDKEYFLRQENNPYSVYEIYKHREIFKIYKKDFATFRKKYKLSDCISKLVANEFKHINGYFLDKELNDDYYKKYTVYKKNESITFSKSNMKYKCDSDGMCLTELNDLISNNSHRVSLRGYFLDKELNDSYYKLHIVYKKNESITFSKNDMYNKYTMDGVCLGELRNLIDGNEISSRGYFLDKELNDDYYKEYTVYKKNESITFSKSNMNGRYTLDKIDIGKFRYLINKKGSNNSIEGWFLDKELHDNYYSIITLYYNNYTIISYKGEVTQNLKKYNLTKVYINELLAGKFIHMKEVYLDETLHNINYCKKYKILIENIPVKHIHNYL